MYGGESRGTQMSTVLFAIAVAMIVLLVGAFIWGLCWVMADMQTITGEML